MLLSFSMSLIVAADSSPGRYDRMFRLMNRMTLFLNAGDLPVRSVDISSLVGAFCNHSSHLICQMMAAN